MMIKMFNPRLEKWCQNFKTFRWSFHWNKNMDFEIRQRQVEWNSKVSSALYFSTATVYVYNFASRPVKSRNRFELSAVLNICW